MTSGPLHVADQAHVYCYQCHAVRPLVLGNLPGGPDASGRFSHATDLMCGKCGLVIATAYLPANDSKAALRRVMARLSR